MHLDSLTHTSAAFIGCLAWIPLAGWILACVHWTIGGDLDPITGFIGIGVAVGLGYEAINPPVPQLAPLTVVAVFVTVIFFPFVKAATEKRQLRNIEIENLEKAYQSLSLRPDNIIAKFRIAKILFELGMCGHAVRIGESLAPNMPQRFFSDELRLLRRWQMTHLDARLFAPISCAECYTSNEAGLIFCRQCGAPFLIDFAKGRVVGSRLGKKLVSSWIALVAVLVGIPIAKSTLSSASSAAVIVAMMGLSLSFVLLAFRDTSGGIAR